MFHNLTEIIYCGLQLLALYSSNQQIKRPIIQHNLLIHWCLYGSKVF